MEAIGLEKEAAVDLRLREVVVAGFFGEEGRGLGFSSEEGLGGDGADELVKLFHWEKRWSGDGGAVPFLVEAFEAEAVGFAGVGLSSSVSESVMLSNLRFPGGSPLGAIGGDARKRGEGRRERGDTSKSNPLCELTSSRFLFSSACLRIARLWRIPR